MSRGLSILEKYLLCSFSTSVDRSTGYTTEEFKILPTVDSEMTPTGTWLLGLILYTMAISTKGPFLASRMPRWTLHLSNISWERLHDLAPLRSPMLELAARILSSF